MSNQPNIKSSDDTAFALVEYPALRDEILKRIEIQTNIVNLTLIIAGTFVSFALQLNNGLILLLYPPIAFGLAASWEQNNLRIRQLGRYIRDRIETRFPNCGWEQFRFDKHVTRTSTARIARVSFLMTEIALVASSFFQTSVQRPLLITLLVIDVIAVYLTAWIIKTHELKLKDE